MANKIWEKYLNISLMVFLLLTALAAWKPFPVFLSLEGRSSAPGGEREAREKGELLPSSQPLQKRISGIPPTSHPVQDRLSASRDRQDQSPAPLHIDAVHFPVDISISHPLSIEVVIEGPPDTSVKASLFLNHQLLQEQILPGLPPHPVFVYFQNISLTQSTQHVTVQIQSSPSSPSSIQRLELTLGSLPKEKILLLYPAGGGFPGWISNLLSRWAKVPFHFDTLTHIGPNHPEELAPYSLLLLVAPSESQFQNIPLFLQTVLEQHKSLWIIPSLNTSYLKDSFQTSFFSLLSPVTVSLTPSKKGEGVRKSASGKEEKGQAPSLSASPPSSSGLLDSSTPQPLDQKRELEVSRESTSGGSSVIRSIQTHLHHALEKAKKVQVELPQVTLILVLDKSGSMAGKPLQLAQSAALASAQTLDAEDLVGVLAFDQTPEWVVEPIQAKNQKLLGRALENILAYDGTDLYPALVEAYHRLKRSTSSIKHILVLTDGLTPPADFKTLAAQLVKDHITLTTVGVGDEADTNFLAHLANWGGGRFYYTNSFQEVPQIFVLETARVVSRKLSVQDKVDTSFKFSAGPFTKEGAPPSSSLQSSRESKPSSRPPATSPQKPSSLENIPYLVQHASVQVPFPEHNPFSLYQPFPLLERVLKTRLRPGAFSFLNFTWGQSPSYALPLLSVWTLKASSIAFWASEFSPAEKEFWSWEEFPSWVTGVLRLLSPPPQEMNKGSLTITLSPTPALIAATPRENDSAGGGPPTSIRVSRTIPAVEDAPLAGRSRRSAVGGIPLGQEAKIQSPKTSQNSFWLFQTWPLPQGSNTFQVQTPDTNHPYTLTIQVPSHRRRIFDPASLSQERHLGSAPATADLSQTPAPPTLSSFLSPQMGLHPPSPAPQPNHPSPFSFREAITQRLLSPLLFYILGLISLLLFFTRLLFL